MKRSVRRRFGIGLLAVTIVLLLGLGIWWRVFHSANPSPDSKSDAAIATAGEGGHAGNAAGTSKVTPTTTASAAGKDTLRSLAHPLDGATPLSLAQWISELRQLSADEASTGLTAFLDSGADASTGAPFRVGPGGALSSAPTWRVAALDLLGEIDTEAAAAYARRIFAESSSADEWALALRNYGRVLEHPAEDAYFTARVRDLLGSEEWRSSPTAGYFEAFDAVVYSGRPEWVGELAEVMEAGADSPLAQAAAIAQESFAARHPRAATEGFRVLAEQNLDGMRPLRASAFARLDARLESDRRELADYVRQLEASSGDARSELDYFLRLYPNANYFVGNFLLTEAPLVTMEEQAQIDAAALAMLRDWQSEVRWMPATRAMMTAASARLEAQVAAALRSGFLSP